MDENTTDIRWATFTVTGKEMVEAGPGRSVIAWVINTDDNGKMTFWITKTAPYVIKLIYIYPNGIKAVYTMM